MNVNVEMELLGLVKQYLLSQENFQATASHVGSHLVSKLGRTKMDKAPRLKEMINLKLFQEAGLVWIDKLGGSSQIKLIPTSSSSSSASSSSSPYPDLDQQLVRKIVDFVKSESLKGRAILLGDVALHIDKFIPPEKKKTKRWMGKLIKSPAAIYAGLKIREERIGNSTYKYVFLEEPNTSSTPSNKKEGNKSVESPISLDEDPSPTDEDFRGIPRRGVPKTTSWEQKPAYILNIPTNMSRTVHSSKFK